MINNDFVKALEGELRRGTVEYNDLMNDFEFVKELNKELSLKYQDFVDSLPKPAEIDIIINQLKAETTEENKTEIGKRIFQLTRFRSAAVLLEKDDPESTPDKFEDLFNGKA